LVVLAPVDLRADVRLTFFLADLAVLDRFADFLAAFFRERPPAALFAMRASFVGLPTVNAKPRQPCSRRRG
jgi:hypothetical protein